MDPTTPCRQSSGSESRKPSWRALHSVSRLVTGVFASMSGFGGFGGGEFGNDDALFGLGEADSVEPDIADEGGFDLDRDDLSNAPPPQANSFDMNGLNGALPEGGLGGGMVSPFFVN
jgi:hypothetical protein